MRASTAARSSRSSSAVVSQAGKEGPRELDEELLDDGHVASHGAHMVAKGPLEEQEPVLRIGGGPAMQAAGDGAFGRPG